VLFQFSNGTNPFNRTASNSSGTWNVSVDTTIIAEGALTVTVFANDTVGNMNSTQTLSVTVDNVADTPAGGNAPSGGGGGGSSSVVRVIKEEVPETVPEIIEEISEEKQPPVEEVLPPPSEEKEETMQIPESRSWVGKVILFAKDLGASIEKVIVKIKKVMSPIASSAIAGGKVITTSVANYALYWLPIMLTIILIVGLYIKDIPIPEFLWKLKPAPQINVEQPTVISRVFEQKAAPPEIRNWGKKNYIDLQQELKRVDMLIKETPLPEQKNKALKLTSFKKETIPVGQKTVAQTQNKKQDQTLILQKLSPEEMEQWVIHMLAFGTQNTKVTAILKNATLLSDMEIKSVLVKARAGELLEKKYAVGQKTRTELKEFIRTEKKKGAKMEQIIADLVQEGWDEKIIRLFVGAYFK
ncbi:MAG: hypothetical protein AABX24_06165, partial [Nanoarchaeota archaeon]